MTVREMLERVDSRELAEWMAFSRLEADRLSGKNSNSDDVKSEKMKASLMSYQASQDLKAAQAKRKG